MEKLFSGFLARNDELLSTLKTIICLEKSLSKLHDPALPSVIPYPLYTFFFLLLF